MGARLIARSYIGIALALCRRVALAGQRVAMISGALLLRLVAHAFAAAGDKAQHLIFAVSHQAWWPPLIITPAGFALVVWIASRYVPESRGSGIPQIIAAGRRPESEAN